MTDASQSAGMLAAWNESGQLYLVVGIATALISWFFLPLAGLLSVYCGLGLWTRHGRTFAGGTIAGVGGVGFALWVAYLASLSL